MALAIRKMRPRLKNLMKHPQVPCGLLCTIQDDSFSVLRIDVDKTMQIMVFLSGPQLIDSAIHLRYSKDLIYRKIRIEVAFTTV